MEGSCLFIVFCPRPSGFSVTAQSLKRRVSDPGWRRTLHRSLGLLPLVSVRVPALIVGFVVVDLITHRGTFLRE